MEHKAISTKFKLTSKSDLKPSLGVHRPSTLLERDQMRSPEQLTQLNLNLKQFSGNKQPLQSLALSSTRKIDYSQLPTSQLPDLQPAVPLESYLNWRYTQRRGKTNFAFDRVQQILKSKAQNAIDYFEKKFKDEEARIKKVNKFISEQNKFANEKINSSRQRWHGVQSRQNQIIGDNLAKSDKLYNQSLTDIKNRIRDRTSLDSSRSARHQTSIQIEREKRKQTIKNPKIETKLVIGALNQWHVNQNLHYNRADSARSERVNSVKRRNMDWEQTCESQMSQMEVDKMSILSKDIDRVKHQDEVINTKNKKLKSISNIMKQNLQDQRKSFSYQQANNALERQKFIQKVDQQKERSDRSIEARKKAINDFKIQQHVLNEQRALQSQKAKEVEKGMLNCIKERVWKKHKSTQVKRKKVLKEIVPLNTWEIYALNRTSRMVRNSFQITSPNGKNTPKESDGLVPVRKALPKLLNLGNPFADCSLRLAISHTPKNPYRLNQRLLPSMIPE